MAKSARSIMRRNDAREQYPGTSLSPVHLCLTMMQSSKWQYLECRCTQDLLQLGRWKTCLWWVVLMACAELQEQETIQFHFPMPWFPSTPSQQPWSLLSVEASKNDKLVMLWYSWNGIPQILTESVLHLVDVGYSECMGTDLHDKACFWKQEAGLIVDTLGRSCQVWLDGKTNSCLIQKKV